MREVVERQTRMPPWGALLGALRTTVETRGEIVPAASRDVIAFRDGVPFEVGASSVQCWRG